VFTKLGANVILVAPDTLLPNDISTWPVGTSAGIDEVLEDVDVLYMLRMQRERMDTALIPGLGEYVSRFSLTEKRAERLAPHALVMHPGPINRGVEITVDPSDLPGSRILQQVTNGVAVRMAVLFTILGGEATATLSQGVEA
jgi:aspartate carbamoyltransferase catalytic subunit